MRKFFNSQLKFEQVATVLQVFIATMLVTLGYIVTPVLFSLLKQQVAGEIGGTLFQIGALTSLGLIALVIAWGLWLKLAIKRIWHWWLAGLLLLALYLVITPMMREIKQNHPAGIDSGSADWATFASLHGVYQLLYMLLIVLMLFGTVKSIVFSQQSNNGSNKKSL